MLKILLHIFAPGHFGVLNSTIAELTRRGHTIFYTSWKGEWETGKEDSWSLHFYEPSIPSSADCTIVLNPPSLWPDLSLPKPIIYMPHGTQIVSPAKVIDLPNACPIDPAANLSLIPGEVHYQQCMMYNFDTKYIITGWPKVDEFVNANVEEARKEVVSELGLVSSKPIIVYAPTSEVPESYIKQLGSLAVYPYPNSIGHLAKYVFEQLKDDYNVIFCPHELDNWKKHMAGLPNVVCPQGENNKPANKNRYLLASDLLIGDRSSIMHEYLITLKPMIHLWNTLDSNNIPLYLYGIPGNEPVAFGPVISAREIKKYVDMLITNPNLYIDLRQKWLKRIFFEPGKATQRVVDEIEKFVEEWKKK